MNFVLVHIGDKLPSYIKHTLNQIQKTNPDSKIYFITNLLLKNTQNVEIIHTSSILIPNIGNYFRQDAMSYLFRNAMLRIFYLFEFIKMNNLEDIISFDNDVLVYENVNNYREKFRKFPLLITQTSDKDFVFGFCYIRDKNSIDKVEESLLHLVLQDREKLQLTLNSMPHEMRLFKYVNEINNNELVDILPVLPEGTGSENFKHFNICFDSLPYGQFLGGYPAEKHHYIGQSVLSGNLKIKFDKRPYGVYKDKRFELFNLHVWNKKLELFI